MVNAKAGGWLCEAPRSPPPAGDESRDRNWSDRAVDVDAN
jgi:hypothetical protein